MKQTRISTRARKSKGKKKDRRGGRRGRKNSQRLKPSKIETSCVTAFRGAQKFRRIFVASRFLAGRSGRESVAAESLALSPAPLPRARAPRSSLRKRTRSEIRTSKGGSTSRGVAARTMIKMELIPGLRPADAHTRLSSITCNHRGAAILSRLVTVRASGRSRTARRRRAIVRNLVEMRKREGDAE